MTKKFSPKIQIVSRYLPYEHTDGQSAYLLDILRYLQRAGCEMELIVLHPAFGNRPIPKVLQDMTHISIRTCRENKGQVSPLQSLNARVAPFIRFFLNRLPDNWRRFIRTGRQVLSQQAIQTRKSFPDEPPTEDEINFFHERFVQFHPHVVIANYTFLGGIFDYIVEHEHVLKVVLVIDIMSQRVQSYRQAGISYHWSTWNQERELAQLRNAEIIAAIQQKEAHALAELLPGKEVFYVPMSSFFHSHDEGEQIPGRCLFVGGGSDHNFHGLQWFLSQIWLQILAAVPHAALRVCGTVCEKIEGHLRGVSLLGRIDELTAEYAAAQVCIVPLIVGSGLKIKLVEALSHGRACVSTSVGAQGVQELREKAVLIADTPHDFAQAVVSVLTNADQRRSMEEEARCYVIEQLSPEKTYQPFVKRIYQHVAQPQQKREST